MDTIQSYSHEFQPQIDFLKEKIRLLNEQLNHTFSPLQLITMTALVTTFSFSIYRFLFAHDEGNLI